MIDFSPLVAAPTRKFEHLPTPKKWLTHEQTVIAPPHAAKCVMIQSMDTVQANAVRVSVCEPL